MMTQHNESSAVKLDNEQIMQMAKLISQNIAPVQAKQWEGSHILVNDYMTEWLEAKHGIDIVQKTYENYEGRYRNHIKPFFEGKTIIPFCTHGGGGASSTYTDIQKLAPNAKISAGFTSYENSATENEIKKWINTL